MVEDYEVISKLKACDSGESSGTRGTKNQDTYPNSVEVFLRQSAGFLSATNRLKIMK